VNTTTVRVIWFFGLKRGEIYLRPTVSWSNCLGIEVPSGVHDHNFVFCWKLCVSWYSAPSLTRGWVCNLLVKMLLGFARAVTLVSNYRRAHDHISLSQVQDSHNLEGQIPVFISPRNKLAQLSHRKLYSIFVASYDSQGYGRIILTRLRTRNISSISINLSPFFLYWFIGLKFKFKLYFDRRSVGQFFLVSGPLKGPLPDLNFLCLAITYYLLAGRPLWREDGSVVCSAITHWLRVAQHPEPYIPISSETPPTWRARSPYLYLPGTGRPSYTPGHWVYLYAHVQVQVILQPTVSRPVRLIFGPLWSPWSYFNFLCSTITFFLLRVGLPDLLTYQRLPQPGGPGPLTHIPQSQSQKSKSR
jgi:hypothetical protein